MVTVGTASATADFHQCRSGVRRDLNYEIATSFGKSAPHDKDAVALSL